MTLTTNIGIRFVQHFSDVLTGATAEDEGIDHAADLVQESQGGPPSMVFYGRATMVATAFLLVTVACIPAMGAENSRGEYLLCCPVWSQSDEGWRAATKALETALSENAYAPEVRYADTPPSGRVIVARRNEAMQKEEYRITADSVGGSSVVRVEGGASGGMYGLFKLAERVRLGEKPEDVHLNGKPAFGMRMFSEQGQLLDIPDRNYYSEESPYVNEAMLRRDIDEAKRQIDHVVQLGYNAITFLHLGFDEYIDYRYLDKPIYAPNDRHLARSPVFCRYMTELCDYAHARHVDIYLQLYEIQFPPELNRLYNVSLDSPNIETIISAKCRELFDRVPLDGLVVTATETHPRCDYRSKCLWKESGRPGAATMLTLYHNACKACGKQAMFRTWRIAKNTAELNEVSPLIPKDAVVETKYTGIDFWINTPLTDIITARTSHSQPLMVTFDTFTQYDGWSRCFCYLQMWGEYVRTCRDVGVQAINAWGDWSPGCVWPDYEPGYLNQPNDAKPQGWAGYWNDYRMFTRGFTPGQSNAYLLARLAWDPDADVCQIARDFCAIHLGPANAQAAADALMQTQQPWREHYAGDVPPPVGRPGYMSWATLFALNEEDMEQTYQRWPMDQMLASNARAAKAIDEMERAFAGTDRANAKDPAVYDRFADGIAETALYRRSMLLFREYWWRGRADRDLNGESRVQNAAAREAIRGELLKLLDQWKRFPNDAAMWRFTFRHAPEAEIWRKNDFPTWWQNGERTTLEWAVQNN